MQTQTNNHHMRNLNKRLIISMCSIQTHIPKYNSSKIYPNIQFLTKFFKKISFLTLLNYPKKTLFFAIIFPQFQLLPTNIALTSAKFKKLILTRFCQKQFRFQIKIFEIRNSPLLIFLNLFTPFQV